MRLAGSPNLYRRTDVTAANPAPPPGGFRASRGYFPATLATYAETSSICLALSEFLNAGIGPPPFSTWCLTRAKAGFKSSRLGPTLPVAPASFSVWQPEQPALVKTGWPAAASPEAGGGAGVVLDVEVVAGPVAVGSGSAPASS